jgi:tRNA dimethylallyltransferase
VSAGPRTLVAVVGATATGKSELAEALAAALDGEVVCADARQVFRELEIGTGKPSPAERSARPHHLFDALALEERPSAGWYARAAAAACEHVFARGRVPVLVGGSGLYVRALLEGLHPEPPHDPAVRERLRADLEAAGAEALHARLARVDPATAARLAPRDRQRVTRALEVYESSGRPLSEWHEGAGRAPLAADARLLEIACPAAALADRIARRTEAMFAGGLVEETRALREAGRVEALARLRAIGYDEVLALLRGTRTRADAIEATNRRTRQLAKRQRTWFRHQVEAARLPAREAWDRAGLAAALAALRLTPRQALP